MPLANPICWIFSAFYARLQQQKEGFKTQFARGGLSQLRCLSARRDAEIALEIYIAPNWAAPPTWRYALGFCQTPGEQSPPRLTYERVWQGQRLLLARPDADDENTPNWHLRTALEDNNRGAVFRELTHFFSQSPNCRCR